jgi:membrane associated rhomboid family serine protease
MTAPAVPVCYRHPGRETYVTCTRCGRPICPECMTEAAVGFQCPECVHQGRRTQRPARTAFGGSRAGAAGYVTSTLVALNVLGLVVGAAIVGLPAVVSDGLFTGVTKLQLLFGDFAPTYQITPELVPPGTQVGDVYTGIDDGAVYRLFTSMFVHYGVLHLLLNMWALWLLGRSLEAALGPVRYLALYLLAGLGGSVAAYVFTPNAIGAGASGAIFGLFAALFIVLKRLRRDTSSVIPVILINLVLTFTVPNISIAGHLGGFVVGGLVALGLVYAPRTARTAVQVATIAATAVLLAAITATAMVT